MPAFERLPRVAISSSELDRQEESWWNKNAALIDRIWGLPAYLCRLAREDYLVALRAALHERVRRSEIKVLEIACGSGWPGRLIADPATKILGIDFSEQQVQLALKKAREEQVQYCSYEQMNINEMDALIAAKTYDAAFVHCGLHHLSGEELSRFNSALTHAQPGFILALIEPLYFDRRSLAGLAAAKLLEIGYRTLRFFAWGRYETDREVQSATDGLFSESNRQNWFLSPKEMPFTLAELKDIFASNFVIEDPVPVTLFGLRAAQDLAVLKQTPAVENIAARWMPVFNRVDRFLLKCGWMPFLTKDYLFSMIIMVRK